MKNHQVKKKILKYNWERWLKRPLYAFMLSLFNESITRKYMRKAGINTEYTASIFQNGVWYKSPEVHQIMERDIIKYLKNGGSIFKVSKSCEKHWKRQQKAIEEMSVKPSENILEKLTKFKNILAQVNAYVWLTYGFEEIYTRRLISEVPKYYKGNVDEFIRNISVSSKKNTHAKLEDVLKSNQSIIIIQKKFGWLKSRDGFADGFSLKELKDLRLRLNGIKHNQKLKRIRIPDRLKKLILEFQELAYFRALRGDARSNLIFLMRPVLRQVAKLYKINFLNLKYYSIYDLIEGCPKYYSPETTVILYKGKMIFLKNPVLKEEKIKQKMSVNGHVAFPGIVRGTARIVTNVQEISKVKDGDILIAQVTFPAFITAMRKAKAFVTDEGGITTHAAIIAREMKKPCIIATKTATRIFKDGDLVEVDANNGVVRRI